MLLTTERLVLRRFRASDQEAFAAYRNDPEIARYQGWGTVTTAADFSRGEPDEPGWFQYAVELVAERQLIGDVGVNTHENRMQASIGYTLAAAHHGRGYATEAVRAILDHLFRVRGLHKVSAECDARNTASARLLTRVGFTQEGHLRSHTWIRNEWTDDLLFGLLATEWLGDGAR
ncbi:GNAT family protein [Actinoplanes sp. NPDC051633]|uniref:GNAT family N-acetyltransferase n=1 Tax=Actinoplanes sp. NPDC051633 TaxID=3155670 RepID=UPI0034315B0F